MHTRTFLLIVPLLLTCFLLQAQQKDVVLKIDSAVIKNDTVRKFVPRKAAIRSAILPGWGQIYNKKYWKVPIVWAAIGIPAGLYIDNKNWYDRCRYALAVVTSNTTNPDSLARVNPQLQPLVDAKDANAIRNYRNQFRRNQDYSALFFLLFWGLNVADATVDAHLKGFDVSDNLSVQIKPSVINNNMAAIGLVFDIHKSKGKRLPLP